MFELTLVPVYFAIYSYLSINLPINLSIKLSRENMKYNSLQILSSALVAMLQSLDTRGGGDSIIKYCFRFAELF
jgi:hypothetical protein